MAAPNEPILADSSEVEKQKTKFVKAVVARGRTVVDAKGVIRKPGEEALVHHRDVEHLRNLGYLRPVGEVDASDQDGLKITSSDGPSVTRVA